jgi:hypothetical protein
MTPSAIGSLGKPASFAETAALPPLICIRGHFAAQNIIILFIDSGGITSPFYFLSANLRA